MILMLDLYFARKEDRSIWPAWVRTVLLPERVTLNASYMRIMATHDELERLLRQTQNPSPAAGILFAADTQKSYERLLRSLNKQIANIRRDSFGSMGQWRIEHFLSEAYIGAAIKAWRGKISDMPDAYSMHRALSEQVGMEQTKYVASGPRVLKMVLFVCTANLRSALEPERFRSGDESVVITAEMYSVESLGAESGAVLWRHQHVAPSRTKGMIYAAKLRSFIDQKTPAELLQNPQIRL